MIYKLGNDIEITAEEYKLIEWLLQNGSAESIARKRIYLSSIVKEYRLLVEKEGSQDEKR